MPSTAEASLREQKGLLPVFRESWVSGLGVSASQRKAFRKGLNARDSQGESG